MFSLALVCLSGGLCKNHSADFHRIRWIGGSGPRKKPSYFGGNPDLVTLELGVG